MYNFKWRAINSGIFSAYTVATNSTRTYVSVSPSHSPMKLHVPRITKLKKRELLTIVQKGGSRVELSDA